MIQIYPETFHEPKRAIPYYSGDFDLSISSWRYTRKQRCGKTVCINHESDRFHLAEKWAANYYHWLHDILSCLVIRQFAGIDTPKIKSVTLCEDSIEVGHVRQWLEILGIEHISRVDQGALNGNCHVEYDTRFSGLVHPEALKLFRGFCRENTKSPKHILVQRNRGGGDCDKSRNLQNRDAIIWFFRKHGIDLQMVFLEGMPVVDQIELFSNAEVVIGVHGAGLANITFCKPECRVIEVASPVFYNESYANIASLVGIRFATVKGYGPMEVCSYNQPVSVDPVILHDILISL